MDLRRADLGLLVSLDALLAERSVTAAARRLGLSQPALSAQLARLRDLMGDDILVGNAHGMTATPRAQALQAPLRQLLAEMSDLIFAETDFDPATSDRHFHIAAVDLSLAAILPPVLHRIGAAAPGLRITTGALDHDRMVTEAEAGRLDLVITNAARIPDSFQTTGLLQTPYRAAWRQGHPRLGDSITLDDFCRLPQLNVSPIEGSLHSPIDLSLQALARQRQVTVSVSSYVLAPALIRASDLIAVVPRILLKLDGAGLVMAPLPFEQPPLSVNLGWHARNRNDRAHGWLRQLITEVSRGLDG